MFSRRWKVVVLAFFCISTKSIAADISGQVTTAEGSPVCALVLASGSGMFSCNPIGQYSLTGLPLEPDGSVRLQVYAEGFYPYLRTITQFGPQPPVIMPFAGSSPVDNGLSYSGALDGTYNLVRGSVIYNNGNGFDTASSSYQATGTMVINGNSVVQKLNLTINGILQPPVSIQDTITSDLGYAVIISGDIPIVFLERRSNKLTTFSNSNQQGSPAAEVDQWVKVSNTIAPLNSDVLLQSYTSSSAPVGAVLGAMAEGQGVKLVPKK